MSSVCVGVTQTSVQSAQRVLQRPPRLLQEAALWDENHFWTRPEPLVALAAQPANHSREGGAQGGESGQQLRVKQGNIWNQRQTAAAH